VVGAITDVASRTLTPGKQLRLPWRVARTAPERPAFAEGQGRGPFPDGSEARKAGGRLSGRARAGMKDPL